MIPVKKTSSPDAFPMEHGGRLRTGFGLIRPSRSYDLLTDAAKGGKLDNSFDGVDGTTLSPPKRKDLFTSQSLPSGVSPG